MLARLRALTQRLESIPDTLRELTTVIRSVAEDRRKDSTRTKEIAIQRSSKNATWFAAVFGGISTIIALFLLGQTLNENERLRTQMYLDERPWVKFSTEEKTEIRVEADQPVNLTYTVKNVGKTIAKNPRIALFLEKLSYLESPGIHGERDLMASGFTTGVLFPDDPNGGDVSWYKPGGIGAVASPTDVAEWKAGKISFVVHGQIHYDDVFGTPHWTHFCQVFVRREGAFTKTRECIEKYNAVDENVADNVHEEPYKFPSSPPSLPSR